MGTDPRDPGPTFELIPRGPEVRRDAIQPLAQNGGELVGAMVERGVCTWLLQEDGQRVQVMWPRAFRARFDPLELLDDRGEVVARGGEFVVVGGGYLKGGGPQRSGHPEVFAVSTVWPRRRPTAP